MITKTSVVGAGLGLALLLTSTFALGQNAYVAQQIKNLQSSNWRERDVAAQRLTAIPRWTQNAEIRAALVRTLEREDAIMESPAYREPAAEQEYDEGYAEYLASLNDDVTQFAAQPGEQRALDALVRSAYNPDSKFAEWLGERGDAIVPAVLDLSRSDEDADRAEAAGVIGELLRTDRKGPPLSSANRVALKAALRAAVLDKSTYVRQMSVRSLGVVGGPEDIPLLEKVAASDPIVSTDDGTHPVRDYARKALQRIQQRTANSQK